MPVLPLSLSLGSSLSRVSGRQSPSAKSSAPFDDLQGVVAKSHTSRSPANTGASILQRRKASKLSIVVPSNSAPQEGQEPRGMFSAHLLRQYDILEVLGQGSAGLVHKAIHKSDKTQVAVKTMQSLDEEMTAIRFQEFELLKTLRHPNIIKTYDCFVSQCQTALILEFFPGKTLSEAVKEAPGRQLSEPDAKELGRLLLRAVDYLHQRRIVHRDVKGENLLVSHDLRDLRLIDFNVARSLLQGGALTMTGTYIYAAPEVLNGESPSEKGDIWSVGVCVLLMLTGRLRYSKQASKGVEHMARTLVENPFRPEHEKLPSVSEPCKRVLCECLTNDKHLRPAAMILLMHEWFKEVVVVRMSKIERHVSTGSIGTASTTSSPSRAMRLFNMVGWRRRSIDAVRRTP